ncbi:MAG: SDR family NAD(P)-dependent oxidoreductase [Candidatus Thermoplasmatota archaeon]|nr:SDR family NAD(P)-dependent oxidoreductase [Candidatus Thermoplasmatota archaeon]
MKNEMSGKTILVTGGTGSIGSEIVKQLLEYDVRKVIVFSRDELKHFMMKKRILDPRLETVVGDIRDISSVQRIFDREKIDLIYHAAAMKHVVVCEDFPTECTKTNVIGTQNIVDLAVKNKVPKMITISTDKAAYPVNAMGASKFIAERITLNSGYSCVRFGNVANSRGSVIPVFIDNIINRKPLTITDPAVTRFIIDIPDAVRLVIKATENAHGGDLFILKMRAFRLGDLLEVMLERIAPKLGIAPHSIKVEQVGLVPGEKMHEDLINATEAKRTYELDGMYAVLGKDASASSYGKIKAVKIEAYTSKDARLLSKDEIERMVLQYCEKYMAKGGLENGIVY